MQPSEILAYSTLTPEDFGVAGGVVEVTPGVPIPVVDHPGNVVHATVASARITFDAIVPGVITSPRGRAAFAHFALSRLYGVLADDAAMNVGLVTQRGGQVNVPLGSHEELMRAAARNLAEAVALYPDALWPIPTDQPSGGSVSVRRTYVP